VPCPRIFYHQKPQGGAPAVIATTSRCVCPAGTLYRNKIYIMLFDKIAPFLRQIVVGDYLVKVVEFGEKVFFNETELA
jgi:hypothetical protein